MKLLPLALLLCGAAIASDNVQLKQVQSVYILPMRSGMDQYLANKIARYGLMQVVTDPQRADAVLTDTIGTSFERKLDELYPLPKPVKVEKDEDDEDKPAKTETNNPSKPIVDAGVATEHTSSFGRGKGTIFLVDRKSRAVIWSTYDRAHDASADTLDKKADQIVNRLKRDLKETK